METSTTITVALVAVIMALVEAVKWLLAKRSNGKGAKSTCALARDERGWLEDLWKQHQRCDVDGTPLWYMPRSLVSNQREMQRAISECTSKINALADTVQRLERIIDRRRNSD